MGGFMLWNNVWTEPNRWMMRYLKRQGWVVFYAGWGDPQNLRCSCHDCWLNLYLDGEKRDKGELNV